MVVGHAVYDPRGSPGKPLRIEDTSGDFATFRLGDIDWYSIKVPEGISLPESNLRVWRDERRWKTFVIYDEVPTVEEIARGERSLEEIPEDDYRNRCRMIGLIDTRKGKNPFEHKHTFYPFSGGEALQDYIQERMTWLQAGSIVGSFMCSEKFSPQNFKYT